MLDMALDLSLSPKNMPHESGAVSAQEIKQLHEARPKRFPLESMIQAWEEAFATWRVTLFRRLAQLRAATGGGGDTRVRARRCSGAGGDFGAFCGAGRHHQAADCGRELR